MPVHSTYPGVYVQEESSGVRTISGVSTSVTAFLGRALKGPVDEPVTINSLSDYDRVFGGLWLNSLMSFTVRDFFLNGGKKAIIVRLHNGATPATFVLPSTVPNDKTTIVAANRGEWGNNLSLTVNHDTEEVDTKFFNLIVREKKRISERHLKVSVDSSSPRYLPKVLEQMSKLIRVHKTSNGYAVSANRPKVTGTPIVTASTRGDDGDPLILASFHGSNFETKRKGLYSLEKTDIFNILCIPPFTTSNDIDPALISSLDAYCKKRRAFLIIDPPSSWTSSAKAISGYATFPGNITSYGALYFPRLKQPNPLKDNIIEEFVPCGAVAGIMARTDSQRGVWKAPAGLEATLVGVPELSVSLTDKENGYLNELGINCLRAFPVYGRLVWGARTLDGADRLTSEWKYIPVRRTALFIEESICRGLRWVVFEPNDEPLWMQIRMQVNAFMHDLFVQGAFQGTNPRDAYFVKCDKETTTQNDINKGIVNILAGFAPLKPAEFVILHLQQMAGKILQ